MQPATSPPTTPLQRRIALSGEAATAALARRLAPVLGPGDVLLLEGPIGAGKSFFARALILARLAAAGEPAEDIPSPTFTLVQTYQAGGLEIWHADLYRLSSEWEVTELGLEEAFSTALCLVEWPDRLGDLTPGGALRLDFAPGAGEGERMISLSGPAAWALRLNPVLEGADA